MSRKGKFPIPLPKGVEVKIAGNHISVKGPKGTLDRDIIDGITVKQDGSQLIVSTTNDDPSLSKFHGLYRSLINNMVVGATQGFETKLEMIGVGYRAALQGNLLDIQIGFSHPVKLPIPTGVTVKIEKGTALSISGIDKQTVGQFAASIRAVRPPEPYQGKGIRYAGEYVRKKAGKTAAAAKK